MDINLANRNGYPGDGTSVDRAYVGSHWRNLWRLGHFVTGLPMVAPGSSPRTANRIRWVILVHVPGLPVTRINVVPGSRSRTAI